MNRNRFSFGWIKRARKGLSVDLHCKNPSASVATPVAINLIYIDGFVVSGW